MISKQPFFNDTLLLWFVMSYVHCQQKQVIHHYCQKILKTLNTHEQCLHFLWDILDRALRSYGKVPTRADRFCHILYSLLSRKKVLENWIHGITAQQDGTKNALTESCDWSKMEAAFGKKLWIPWLEIELKEYPWQKTTMYFWIFFGTCGNEMEQLVPTRLIYISKMFQRIGMM